MFQTEETGIKNESGKQGGKTFSDRETDDGTADLRRSSFGIQMGAEPENASDAGELLGDLSKRRNAGALNPIKIAVDQRMQGAERDGQRKNTEQRRAARFFQKRNGDAIRIAVKDCRAEDGQRH